MTYNFFSDFYQIIIPLKETHRDEEGTNNKEECNIPGYNKYAR